MTRLTVNGAFPTSVFVAGRGSVSASAECFDTVDPSTGEAHAEVARGNAVDVDRAVCAAADAGDRWRSLPPLERARGLRRASEVILARADELVHVDQVDAGLPTTMARADVVNAARYFEYYAGAADKLHGESIPLGRDFIDYTLREPHGVCAVVTPFNVPIQMVARSVAPALAAGNTVVLKPAEQAPLPPLALAAILSASGLPDGVVNMVPGFGPEVGEPLIRHELVRHVTFTGSLATGRRVAAGAAERIVPATIELGGKSPQIVFADADRETAADAIVASALRTAGQVCSAGTRVLVERSVYATFADMLTERARALRVGPAVDGPDMGPLVSAQQRDRVLEGIERASREGARVLTGGGLPPGVPPGGYYVEPTVLADVAADAYLAREELFGPVLAIMPFDTVEQALELANDSAYGLVAGIWTRRIDWALGLASAIEAGQIFVNNYGVAGGVELPFGGVKLSGTGREKGLAALHEYTYIKNVCVKTTLW